MSLSTVECSAQPLFAARSTASVDLAGKVDAREQQLRHRHRRLDASLLGGAAEQLVEHVEGALDAEMVRRAAGAAHEREQLAVLAHEREVGLRVAAVDGEDDPPAHATASASSSRSSSPSTRSTWPISGCASRALRATERSRVVAASAASRS